MSSRKIRFLVGIIIVLFVLGIGIMATTAVNLNRGMQYNDTVVKLRVPKSKILFSRPNSTDGSLDIYTINADGTGLRYLYKVNPQEWLNKAAQNTVFADMVDQYPGYTEYNGKKVKLERSPTSEKLILLDNKKQIILKQSQGFFSTLGINSFKWMSDGRHILIEDNRRRIGILDTITGKYAYLTNGELAISQ